MLDAVMMLLEDFNRVLAGEGQMAGIINQADIFRISQFHQLVDLTGLLYGSGHVMMVHNLHAIVIGNLAQMIQSLCQNFKFIIIQNTLVGKRRIPLMLDGIALVGYIDDLCANGLEEIHVVNKCSLIPPHWLLVDIGADPCSDCRNTTASKFLIQDSRVTRILAANLRTNITC